MTSNNPPAAAETLAAAHEALLAAQDPPVRALAKKALLQSAVLDHSGGAFPFEGEAPTDIGIFRVLPTVAEIDWASDSGALRLEPGQTYLDYHLPKSADISNANADESYAGIAAFVQTRPEITHLMGVTHRIMALSAQRNQGFSTEPVQLPEPVMAYAAAFWQRMMPEANPRHFKTAHLVWHTRASLIERFAPSNPGS